MRGLLLLLLIGGGGVFLLEDTYPGLTDRTIDGVQTVVAQAQKFHLEKKYDTLQANVLKLQDEIESGKFQDFEELQDAYDTLQTTKEAMEETQTALSDLYAAIEKLRSAWETKEKTEEPGENTTAQ